MNLNSYDSPSDIELFKKYMLNGATDNVTDEQAVEAVVMLASKIRDQRRKHGMYPIDIMTLRDRLLSLVVYEIVSIVSAIRDDEENLNVLS